MTDDAHYADCETLLRERDRDLWLACLFAPQPARRHIHAIYAYAIETADVRARVTQPLLGEMRLRWWADAIEDVASEAGQGARAHPIADALLDTIARFDLPRDELAALAETRMEFELYDDPPPTLESVERFCRTIMARPMRWSARILGAEVSDAGAFDAAGMALGLTRILRALPAHAEGQSLLPLDLLSRHNVLPDDIRARRDSPALRAALAELRTRALAHYEAARGMAAATPGRAALLAAATTPLFLERMARKDYDPFQPLAEPSPLRRQWRLWRAARGVGL